MAFNLQVQPMAGQYTAQAGQQIAENIQKLLAKREEDKKQEAFNDALIGSLHDSNYVPGDAMERYLKTKNVDEKSGIVTAGLRSLAIDQAKQAMNLQKAQVRLYGAEAAHAQAQADEVGGGPEDNAVTATPYIDPVTKQPVAGMGIVHGRGNQFQIVYTPQGQIRVERDPTSGALFYRDNKGNPKPISAGDVIGGQIGGGGAGDQQPTFNQGGPATAAPALSARDQQALAWAKANPTDARAAAILKKLGVTP